MDEQEPPVPVITVDGPSGAGKGTLAEMLAEMPENIRIAQLAIF